MSNEITYTGYGDLKLATVLAAMLHELTADTTDLRPTCEYVGSITGLGSQAIEVTQARFDDAMAAANTDEVSAPGNTALTTATQTITVARQVLVRTLTDLYAMTGGPGPDLQRFVQDMFSAAVQRFTDMLCALFGSLSASAGTSGTALTVDDIMDGLDTLRQNNVPGPYFLVLHHVQYGDFVESLRGEGQSIVDPDSASMLAASGPGFQGVWNNINIFSVDSVGTSGSDYIGALYGMGCFAYADGVPDASIAALAGADAAVTSDGTIWVEVQREAVEGHAKVVGNYYVGVSEIEDGRGVKIVSAQ